MADINTDQQFNATLVITDPAGNPAPVNGAPVWATSDATVLSVTASADGMSCVVGTVAPGTARVTVTADADVVPGGAPITITGVSEDINVTLGPSHLASQIAITLGAPVAKPPPTPPGP